MRKSWICHATVIALLTPLLATTGPASADPVIRAAGDVIYAHDAAGRVSAAFDPTGAGVKYRYDANDNVIGVVPQPADRLAVVQSGPRQVVIGDRYTIYGTGFGTDQADVRVTVGGTAATLKSLLRNRIVVTVPAGASSGQVQVTVAGQEVAAGQVEVLAAPSVESTGPRIVDRSASITVTGSGFDPVLTRNTVTLDGTRLRVLDATPTKLTVRAPNFGAAGSIAVRTRAGQASGSGVVVVPPAPFLAADVAAANPLTMGQPSTIETESSNQIALFYVKPDVNNRLSFRIDNTFSGCVELHVWAPDRTAAYAEETECGDSVYVDLPERTDNGHYLVQVDPRDEEIGSATVTARQSMDATGQLEIDGPRGSRTTTGVPSHAVFTFQGKKGDLVFTTLDAGEDSRAAGAALRAPSGDELGATGFFYDSGDYLPATLLPETGTYTIDIDPEEWERGTYMARVSSVPDPVEASMDLNGEPAAAEIAKPGQTASVSFEGVAGKRVHIDMTGGVDGGIATLRGPDGGFLFRDEEWSYFESYSVDRYKLPKDGEYLLLLEPDGAQTGTIKVNANTVPADTTTQAAIGDPAVTIANNQPGQNARVTFAASVGQRIMVSCEPKEGQESAAEYVLVSPNGDEVDSTSTCSDSYQDGVLFPTRTLRADGSWTVLADFAGSRLTSTTIRVHAVPDPLTADTTLDAAAKQLSLKPGQRGVLSFPVQAGQRFFVLCSLDDYEQQYDIEFELRRPNGAAHETNSCNESDGGALFETIKAQSAGTWKVAAIPGTRSPVGLSLHPVKVPADAQATAEVGGPGKELDLAVGQNGTVSFNVAAGQRFLVACTLANQDQEYDVELAVLRPNGSEASTESCSDYQQGVLLDTTKAGSAGTWKVTIDPDGATDTTITIRVYDVPNDVTKSTSIGGTPVDVRTVVGQSARITFTGSANQDVAITPTASSYPSCEAELILLAPNGDEVESSCVIEDLDLTATLPSDGEYTIVLDPDYRNTGSATIKVAADAGKTTSSRAPPEQREAEPASSGPVYPRKRDATLTGRILRTDGTPLSGVTVTVADRSAKTLADGRFRLTGLPQGTWLLAMDGRTASTDQARYGYFDVQVNLRHGVNRLHYQPYLPALDTEHEIPISSPTNRDIVVSNPKVPGLEVHIPKGTRVTDADGKPVDHLGITPIPVDRTPIPMPKGVQVPVYFTVQPAGGEITGGKVQIYYPNYLDQEPGTRVNFWTHEKLAEGWEVYGQGYVNGAGTQVVPDAETHVENFDGAMINVDGWLPGLLRGLLETLGAAGDPVDLGTGRFTYTQTDLTLGGNIPIQLERGFSSGDRRDRSFGMGTIGTYDTYLTSDDQWQEADLNLVDGSAVHFERTSPGTSFTDAIMAARTANPEFAGATLAWNGLGWDLKLRDGTVLVFGDEAPLQSIRDQFGHTVNIRRVAKNGYGSQIGAIVSVTSSEGYWLDFEYDNKNHVTDVTDNAGRTVKYGYDNAGRLTKVTDVKGGVTTYGWNAKDQLVSITDATGEKYLTNSYDNAGRIAKQNLADGSSYNFSYQVDGQRISMATVTDPSGQKRVVNYDRGGYLVGDRVAVGTSQERGYTVTRAADTHVATKVTDTDGRTVTSTYDNLLRATKTTGSGASASRSETATYNGPNRSMSAITDAMGHTTKYGFDDEGNVNRITDPAGRTSTVAWNDDGLPAASTDAQGNRTRYEWLDGSLAATIDPMGRRTEYVVDAIGRTSQVIAPDGGITTTQVDAANQVTSVTDSLGRTTKLGYDANGNLTRMTAPGGAVTSYRYDMLDQLVRETDPLGKQTRYTYTPAGDLATITDRRGKTTEFRYNAVQQPTFTGFGRTGSAGSYDYESTQTYGYDNRGRLATIADTAPGAGSITYKYDDFDRIISETSTAAGGSGSVGRQYDKAGRLTRTTISGLPAIEYRYDDADRLVGITQGSVNSEISYHPSGAIKSQTLPGGITRTNEINAAGDLTSIQYSAGNASLGAVQYSYDDAGRLTRSSGPWSRTELPTPLSNVEIDDANRLLKSGNTTFDYDADGNLTKRTGPAGATTYTWDARGRLVKTNGPDGTSAITYDAADRRTRTVVDGKSWGYRYDDAELVAQNAPTGTDLTFVNGGGVDQVLAAIAGSNEQGNPDASGAASALLTDRTGSVIARASGDQLLSQYTYDPYGATRSSLDGDINPVRYTGRESGPGAPDGLQYNRSRWYDRALGRFVSEDPAAADTNLYAYAAANPVDVTDPSGEIPAIIGACAAGGAINTLAGALLGRKHSVGDYLRGFGKGCLEGAVFYGAGRIAQAGLRSAAGTARAAQTSHVAQLGDDGLRAAGNAYSHGYRYHPRIRQRGVQDPRGHNFPYSFDDAILSTTPTRQADGSLLYQMRGSIGNSDGLFEIALNPRTGVIFHRTFRSGG